MLFRVVTRIVDAIFLSSHNQKSKVINNSFGMVLATLWSCIMQLGECNGLTQR